MRFFSPSLPFLALALGCFTTLGFSGGRLAAQGTAKTVSIGWNANPEPDIAGYRIHIGTGTGTGSGALAETMTVGTTPAADLAGLASDTTYHCAVLAFNSAGLESPLSQEISFTTAAATAELPEISVEQLAGPALVDGQGAVSLGSTVVGSAGITTEFLVKNVGTAPLTGLALVVDGPDFSAASLGATSLAPGASATVELTFRPVAAGNRAGSLFIASNDADENPFRIALSGTGVGVPEISVQHPAGVELTDGTAAVNFSNSDLGSTGPAEIITIRNAGTASLTGLTVVSGSSEFIASQPASGTLAPGTSTTFQIAFKPTAAGTRTATLQITSNDADENPFDISLVGNGVAYPEIAVERANGTALSDGAATVNLGSVSLGSASAAETLVIRNLGTAALAGIAVVSGSGEFTVSQPASGTLAPGASTTFQITFRPSAAGARGANLQITSNDADENPFDISLAGNGVANPEIAVERANGTGLSNGAATVSLGAVHLGSVSAAETLVIRNLGTATLAGIAISAAGDHFADFSIQSSGVTTLAPGASTTFQITFRPTAAGIRGTDLRITSNDADENPFDIALTGTGVAIPQIAISRGNGNAIGGGDPAAHFGSAVIGTGGLMETFTISNPGTAPLTGLTIVGAGANPGDFKITAPAAGSLAPGASTTFQVTFEPTAAGSRAAVLQIASNDPVAGRFDIALAGTGVAVAEIALLGPDLTPLANGSSALAFGNADLGATASPRTITIRNTGSAALTGISPAITGTADFTIVTPPAATLQPGASTTFQIAFAPAADGPRTATLSISSSAPADNPFVIALSGNGVAFPVLAVETTGGGAAPADLAFGTVDVGAAASARTFIVRNTGTAAIDPLSVVLTGPAAADFVLAAPTAGTLAPGAAAAFSLTFKPASGGGKSAVLRVSGGSVRHPAVELALSGTAIAKPEIAVILDGGLELAHGAAVPHFGNAPIKSEVSRRITIKNVGTGRLTGIAIRRDGKDFKATSAATALAPGASTTFRVTFSPTASGTRQGTISIVSDDPARPSLQLRLTGTGIDVPQILVTLGKNKALKKRTTFVNFGTGQVKKAGRVETFTIRNTGTATLGHLAVRKSGLHSSDFSVSRLRAKSLAPGASAKIKVTFRPGASGTRWGALRITSNGVNQSTIDIGLTGKGKSAGPSAKKSKRKAKSSKLASSATGNVVKNGEKFRTLTLRKSPDHDYQPRDIQVSSDLVEWSSGEDHTTVIVDGSRVLSVRDNTPVRPGMKRYIRLRPSAR